MDIERLRDEKLAEEVRESQRKRFKSVYLVDLVISLDTQWRKSTLSQQPRAARGCISFELQCVTVST